MPSAVFNRVRLTVASAPGTGAISLGSAVNGYRTYATAGATTGLLVNYLLEDGTAWEYGRGTWSSSGPTLTRTTILGSSNGGAAINASAATIVSCDAFAEDVTNQPNFIATTGDLSASPAANVTFLGLNNYTDIFIDFVNVTNDGGSSQTYSASISLDGTSWSASNTITASTASTNYIFGQITIFGNGTDRPILQSIVASNNNIVAAPAFQSSLSNLVRVIVSGAASPVVGIRLSPTTSGNFNKGTITARGR